MDNRNEHLKIYQDYLKTLKEILNEIESKKRREEI